MTKYLLNSMCIPVKGYNRSIIYDLTRNDYFFIPNHIFKIINKKNGFTIESIEDVFKELLIKNEIIFKVNESNIKNFPSLKTNFISPYFLETLILNIKFNNEILLKFLATKSINNLTILIEEFQDAQNILKRINYFLEYIHIESLNLVFKNENVFKDINIEDFIYINELFEIYIFNSETSQIEKKFNFVINNININFDEFINNVFHKRFVVNKNTFLKSKNYNAFYYKKIFIDDYSILSYDYNKKYILNDINEIQNIKELTSVFNIVKDDILVCKNCEFRNMCLDPRIPIKLNDSFYFDRECNYNPFISIFSNEEGYKNLKDSGIIINNLGKIKINNKILKQTFNEAWAE